MKKRIYGYILLCLCLFCFTPTFAQNDPFTKTNPKWFHHWWLEATMGDSDFAFTNVNLQPGFHSQSVETNSLSYRGELGYNFNHYFALGLSLMRGKDWVKYHDITPNDWHTVWNSLFGIMLRGTLPLGGSVGLYGSGGVGYISRHGFRINGVRAVNDGIVLTSMFGAGFIFNVWRDLFIDINTIYALPNQNQNQPHTWYGGLGFLYLLGSSPSPSHEMTYWFPHNFMQLDYMNKSWFYVNAANAVYLPIFFTADLFVKQGIALMYERTFFHTNRVFSLEMGATLGNWSSSQLQQNFTSLTLFPEIKLWLVRCPRFDLYFSYSLAGPTVITRKNIDNQKTGTYFTFQDFMGLGTFLGKNKRFNINIQIMHFSNGNLFPYNPGIDIPLMFGLGYSF